MKTTRFGRALGVVAVVALAMVPVALASAAFADDPAVQSTATVANGEELRQQWAIGNNTLITLTANIDLGLDGEGNNICEGGQSGEPVRTDGGGITVDGQGLYGITQTCPSQRVLRDESEGETVTLLGLTHFTGGEGDGNGGGLRNDGPVNVIDSNVSGNGAFGEGCELADASAQVVCPDNGDGGGIYVGESSVHTSVVGPGYDIVVTDSTVADNEAYDDGGGVYTEDTLTATRSTFSGNIAHGYIYGGGRGGGAFADEGVTASVTTFNENEAECSVWSGDFCLAESDGGGFHTYGPANVSGSTFTFNHAYDSGGGFIAYGGAVVDSSSFTGNQAGGEGAFEEASTAQLPAPLSGNPGATDSENGSQGCDCVGGGFASVEFVDPSAALVSSGAAQVTGSTFVGNGAGCNFECFGAGGGFFAANGSTVSGSTFGDGSDEGSNAAGCFEACGAMGGGFYSGGNTAVDTSTFLLNGNGCLGLCAAEGGGFFAGNGLDQMSAVAGLAERLPQGVSELATGDGTITVVQSTFTANEAGCIFFACAGSGGGFYASTDGTVDVTASTFNANDALFDGGAISINGGVGAAICTAECGPSADTTITNSTVTGNFSGYPAAISVPWYGDTLTLVNDTIDSNTLLIHEEPEGIPLAADSPSAQECECYAANIAVAGEFTSFGTDVTHPLLEAEVPFPTFDDIENCWTEGTNSEGFNFSDDDSCDFTDSTDNVADGNDPMLGELGNNGGPTATMLPLPGSPLIDAIQPVSECQVDVDQRGVTRPQIKGCDTGAVEVLGASVQVEKVVTGTLGNPVPSDGYSFHVSCSDGSAATLTVADATNGGSSDVLADIEPGATCSVTEDAVVYTNPLVVFQPAVTVDPAVTAPLGEGDHAVVTVTNNYDGINLLGELVAITPKFTG